jgi:excisionase family DNA binding protein
MQLMTIDDVKTLLNISKTSVRRELLRGNLSAVKIGKSLRFKPEDVEAYINNLPLSKGGE